MDEDLIAGIIMLMLFIVFPAILVLSITACIAGSRTRAWKKEQARLRDLASTAENEALVQQDAEEEDDFLDTEDEEDYKAKKAEEEADRKLTPRQKFRKEFKKCWSGKGAQEVAKEREREERKKVAKAVAREIERLERRRAKRNGGSSSRAADDLLPRYEATAPVDRKE